MKCIFLRREVVSIMLLLKPEYHFTCYNLLQSYTPDKFLAPFLKGVLRVVKLEIEHPKRVSIL
jgi:hypothetical protein